MNPLKLTPIALATAAMVLGAGASSASAHTRKPLFNSFSYTPIGEVNSEVEPKATFTATIRLYARAPSVEFAIYGNGGNIATGVFPTKTYGPGLHHITVKGEALPAGTFKITLVVHLPAGRHLDGANPATLVVSAAGPGQVTKL